MSPSQCFGLELLSRFCLKPVLLCRHPDGCEESESKEAVYTLRNQAFRHTGTMWVNRMQMIENLCYMYPDTRFIHRSVSSLHQVEL